MICGACSEGKGADGGHGGGGESGHGGGTIIFVRVFVLILVLVLGVGCGARFGFASLDGSGVGGEHGGDGDGIARLQSEVIRARPVGRGSVSCDPADSDVLEERISIESILCRLVQCDLASRESLFSLVLFSNCLLVGPTKLGILGGIVGDEVSVPVRSGVLARGQVLVVLVSDAFGHAGAGSAGSPVFLGIDQGLPAFIVSVVREISGTESINDLEFPARSRCLFKLSGIDAESDLHAVPVDSVCLGLHAEAHLSRVFPGGLIQPFQFSVELVNVFVSGIVHVEVEHIRDKGVRNHVVEVVSIRSSIGGGGENGGDESLEHCQK